MDTCKCITCGYEDDHAMTLVCPECGSSMVVVVDEDDSYDDE